MVQSSRVVVEKAACNAAAGSKVKVITGQSQTDQTTHELFRRTTKETKVKHQPTNHRLCTCNCYTQA